MSKISKRGIFMRVLSEEEQIAIQTIKSFVKNEIAPIAKQIDEEDQFPSEIIMKLGKLGFMGVFVPSEFGGVAFSHYLYALIVEEVSSCSGAIGTILSAHSSLACWPILHYGTKEQKETYLTPMATGKVLGCFGLTEPEAGSDAANLKTIYVRDGDFFILNGSKAFITNASKAKYAVIFATKDRSLGYRGISAFVIATDTTGFKVGKPEHKLGIHGADSCPIDLEEVRVPKNCILGREGEGFKIALSTLDGGRIGIAAQAVGLARGAFERALEYSKVRIQFDKPIIEFQAIQWMLADMITKIEAARFIVLKSANLMDEGKKSVFYSSMAKLFAAETAMEVTTKAIQIFGGYGYIKDYEIERFFRDAKITEIYEGTSEIQRLVIANLLRKDDKYF